jgi:anaerobic magnesium-protoporphyrin IX monomethyl ester cyclase
MKLVFILPTLRSPYKASPEPPLGLAYLAASLLDYKNDLQIEIIDGFLLERSEYQKKISNINADIIGVSTTMAQLSEALMIPSIVKRKKARFIIGGPGVENLPSNRFYESGYSIVCYGEGERTIVELVAAIENGLSLEGVKGISYIDKGREIRTPPRELIKNLDDLPFPARELLDMKRYLNIWKKKMGFGMTQTISSRGCPYSCKFCDNKIFGRKIRFMSPSRMIEEMKLIYDIYKADMIYFEEDLFTLKRKRVLEFCSLMKKELPGKKWGAHSRVDTIDLEMMTRMKQAGCTDITFGVESGSQKILDILGKGITVQQIENAFRWANLVGIRAGMFLIIGVPGETQEDIDMTKTIIAKAQPSSVDISFLTPIPGTEIYESTKHLIRDGIELRNYNDLLESIYRKDLFEVELEARRRELVEFFLNSFKGKVDPRLSLFDGTPIAG